MTTADDINTQLQRALALQLADSTATRVVLISRNPQLAERLQLPADALQLTDLQEPTELDSSLRWDLAVVIDQLEHMSLPSGLALLARLRDCHCDDVLLHTANQQLSAQEMLALGFMPANDEGPGRWFRYQRDHYFERRAWNSPEQWAHPENFRRKRW